MNKCAFKCLSLSALKTTPEIAFKKLHYHYWPLKNYKKWRLCFYLHYKKLFWPILFLYWQNFPVYEKNDPAMHDRSKTHCYDPKNLFLFLRIFSKNLQALCSIMQHFLKWKQLFNIGTCFKWYTINQKIHVTSSLLKSRKQLKISLMALGSF